MPYFAVSSGNILRCVIADDAKSACVTAVTLHCNDVFETPCSPGQVFQVAELGKSHGDDLYILSEHIRELGAFTVKNA